HVVDGRDPVCHRIARDVEPTPTTCAVHPPLEMPAPRIDLFGEITRPRGVIDLFRRAGPDNITLSSTSKLDLVAGTTPWAGYTQHDDLSVRCRNRPLRR